MRSLVVFFSLVTKNNDEPLGSLSFNCVFFIRCKQWQWARGSSLSFPFSLVVENDEEPLDCCHLLIFYCSALSNKLEEWRWTTRPIIVFWLWQKKIRKQWAISLSSFTSVTKKNTRKKNIGEKCICTLANMIGLVF